MTHPTPDPLRKAAQAVLDCWDSRNWKAAPTADYMRRLRAALAAAPQPAPAPAADEREAMIRAMHMTADSCPLDRSLFDTIADALLADGYRKADPLADERVRKATYVDGFRWGQDNMRARAWRIARENMEGARDLRDALPQEDVAGRLVHREAEVTALLIAKAISALPLATDHAGPTTAADHPPRP